MKLTLTIQSDSAAFQNGFAGIEAARIIRSSFDTLERFEGGEFDLKLFDSDDNAVGSLSVEHESEQE